MQLIAKAGLDAVTVRDVAEAAGCSTAIVSHYFHNKKELLHLTYTAAIERATARAESALAASGDLKAYLAEIMPLDEDRLTEWSIWLAFWAKAVSDPDIAAAQRNCVLRTRGNILRILDDLNARGELVANVDRPHVARRVLATITGMAVQVMFDREDWPTERQHGLIDPELRDLYKPSRIPASIAAQPPPRRENVVAIARER